MAEGPKINLTKWKELRKRVRAAAGRDARVKVGVFGSAGKHALPGGGEGISMVELAAIHEFGSEAANIPERSFLRRTMELREQDLHKIVARLTKAYVSGKYELDKVLGLLGEWVVAAVRNTITTEQVEPRLAESAAGQRTIKRKGSHVTLVDHGQLLKSISYQIVGIGAPSASEADAGDAETESGDEE